MARGGPRGRVHPQETGTRKTVRQEIPARTEVSRSGSPERGSAACSKRSRSRQENTRNKKERERKTRADQKQARGAEDCNQEHGGATPQTGLRAKSAYQRQGPTAVDATYHGGQGRQQCCKPGFEEKRENRCLPTAMEEAGRTPLAAEPPKRDDPDEHVPPSTTAPMPARTIAERTQR